MVDSLTVAKTIVCSCPPVIKGSTVMDTVLAIAMAIIAVANIILTVFIFRQTRRDTNEGAKKHRKFELIQTLILNNKLHLLYDFYDAIENECKKLLSSSTKDTKKAVNDFNVKRLIKFRREFTVLFGVVDQELSESLKRTADTLIDGITEAIFDDGINLTHAPKYKEKIIDPIVANRNSMLSMLFGLADLKTNNRKRSQKVFQI